MARVTLSAPSLIGRSPCEPADVVEAAVAGRSAAAVLAADCTRDDLQTVKVSSGVNKPNRKRVKFQMFRFWTMAVIGMLVFTTVV